MRILTRAFRTKPLGFFALISGLLIPIVAYAGWVGAHLETGSTSNTISDGDESAVIGSGNDLSEATHSLAVGTANEIIGTGSIVTGYSSDVGGSRSGSWGQSNQTLSNGAMSIGKSLINEEDHSVVVGSYNDDQESGAACFVVGTGSSSSSLNNALTVRKSGQTEIKKVPAKGKVSMGIFTQP